MHPDIAAELIRLRHADLLVAAEDSRRARVRRQSRRRLLGAWLAARRAPAVPRRLAPPPAASSAASSHAPAGAGAANQADTRRSRAAVEMNALYSRLIAADETRDPAALAALAWQLYSQFATTAADLDALRARFREYSAART